MRRRRQCGYAAVLCVIGFLENSGYAIRFAANADGSGSAMAKLIAFYVPGKFRKRMLWIPLAQRGKVIEFPSREKKSA